MLGYLPQTLPLAGDLTVAEVLGIAPVINALDAIESGDTGEEHFTTIGNDWDIEERTRAQLDRLGLADVDFARRLHTLSGGQVISLGLAAQLLKRPDVLLLDEPTNNLDLDARRKLYGVLEDWTGCLLLDLVSIGQLESALSSPRTASGSTTRSGTRPGTPTGAPRSSSAGT